MADNVLVEKEKTALPHHHHLHHQQQQQHSQQQQLLSSLHPSIKSLSEETRKHSQQQPLAHKMNTGFHPDVAKSKMSPSSVQPEPLKPKLQNPNNTQCHPYPNTNSADLLKAKSHSGLLDISKPKPNTSPEVSKHKIPRYSDTSPSPTSCVSVKAETAEPPRSGFKPVVSRTESGGASSSCSSGTTITKSPLIIDKNETFTVYRDPALVRSDSDSSASASVSSNHVAAYLHSHLHPLHPPSPHSPCLTPASHPHAASHLLAPPHSSALPHPHLLPPGVLPAMPPPGSSLLGGHPRLDSPAGLGHLTLPHPVASHHQQQQFLQVLLLIYVQAIECHTQCYKSLNSTLMYVFRARAPLHLPC